MPRGAAGGGMLRELGVQLKAKGAPATGIKKDLTSSLRVVAQPIKSDVQRNAFAIPSSGERHTGLRVALMRATRVEVRTMGRNVGVRVIVDGKKMPAGQQSLPTLVEGYRHWRHPVDHNRLHWVDQPGMPHPIVKPAVDKNLPAVVIALDAALLKTAAELGRG